MNRRKLDLKKNYPKRCKYWTIEGPSRRGKGYCSLKNSGVGWTNSDRCRHYFVSNEPNPDCKLTKKKFNEMDRNSGTAL